MRSMLLGLVLAAAGVGLLGLTPSTAEARNWRSNRFYYGPGYGSYYYPRSYNYGYYSYPYGYYGNYGSRFGSYNYPRYNYGAYYPGYYGYYNNPGFYFQIR